MSPGSGGPEVFNPLIIAEFRRWRARPVTYLAMVFVALLSITAVYFIRTNALDLGGLTVFDIKVQDLLNGRIARDAGPVGQFTYFLVPLLIRPSTIIPLMMVWRCLWSFRNGHMFAALRTTFLRPGDFLWGVIAVPFFISGIVLVLYTGLVLMPGLIESHFARPGEYRTPAYWLRATAILYEGALNGAVVSFIALYFGIRGRVRPAMLVPVFFAVLGVQCLTAWAWNAEWLVRAPLSALHDRYEWFDRNLRDIVGQLWVYFVAGTPKLVLTIGLWYACKRLVRGGEE